MFFGFNRHCVPFLRVRSPRRGLDCSHNRDANPFTHGLAHRDANVHSRADAPANSHADCQHHANPNHRDIYPNLRCADDCHSHACEGSSMPSKNSCGKS